MEKRTCPVWVGYFLACPIRKLWQNPNKILSPYILGGMKVLDIGSAMGFFSIPMAKNVGNEGCVVCVDIGDKMLERLEVRSKKAGTGSITKMHKCTQDSLLLKEYESSIDFALAFAVIHEFKKPEINFSEIYLFLKPGGAFLISEPKGHVTEAEFNLEIEMAKAAGFVYVNAPDVPGSRSAFFKKNK